MKLVVENVTRSFGTRRIFGPLSFSVESGRVFGVAGANGSGKTTLVRTLAGLLRPSSGDVWLEEAGDSGAARAGPRDSSDRIGWVAPDLNLYGELTAAENLSFFAAVRGLPAGDEHLGELLLDVGLEPARVARQPVRALSTGQRQRLKLAFATLHAPPLLLLDEPSSNLDEAGRAIVAKVVASQRLRGAAVIASNDVRDLALSDERVQL